MASSNPYSIVYDLEERISEWCGSPYAVAVDSNSMGLFLSLQYLKRRSFFSHIREIEIPRFTYPSAACSIIHAGWRVKFTDEKWVGEYDFKPLQVWDAALRFKKNMYHGGFQVLSFHIKKHLPVGRGGIILLEDKQAYEWLKRARFDGRNPVPLLEDSLTQLGWNCYLEPSQAAKAIQLFEVLRSRYPEGVEDLRVEDQGYSDLSQYDIYQQ